MKKLEMLEKENKRYCEAYKDAFKKLDGKKILVFGSSGLVGSHLVKLVDTYNKEYGGNILLICFGRDKKRLLSKLDENEHLICVESDYKSKLDIECDCIINCASNTSSQSFIHNPANTILDNIAIMKFTLDIAARNKAKYLYTSSQEMYGEPTSTMPFSEDDLGYMSTTVVRNSYPYTKRISEMLAWSFGNQYDFNICICRLAKCYALDNDINDKRVVADFTRKASQGENIILKTTGEMKSTFAYIMDVVAGMIVLLSKDIENGVYNLGSPNSDYSIKDMANIVAQKSGVSMIFELEDSSKTGYATVKHMLLNLGKSKTVGFEGLTNLEDGLKMILEYNKLK